MYTIVFRSFITLNIGVKVWVQRSLQCFKVYCGFTLLTHEWSEFKSQKFCICSNSEVEASGYKMKNQFIFYIYTYTNSIIMMWMRSIFISMLGIYLKFVFQIWVLHVNVENKFIPKANLFITKKLPYFILYITFQFYICVANFYSFIYSLNIDLLLICHTIV